MQIESIGTEQPDVFGNMLRGNESCDKGHLKVAAFPQFIGLESTTKCNIDCIQCGLKSHPLKNRDIPDEVLRLLSEGGYLDRATSLLFSDYGETLMGSRFEPLLDLVERHKLPVSSFFTNGTLLTEESARRIVEAQVKLIIVSMDAATKPTYEAIRRRSDFELVVGNIEMLQRIKAERGSIHPRLHFNCVGMKSNVEELPDLVRLAHRLGVEAVVYSNLVPYSYELSQEALARVPELAAEKKREARAVGRTLGVRLGLAESHLPIAQDAPEPLRQEADLGEDFFSGSLEVQGVPAEADMGEFLAVQARLENQSRHPWLSTHSAQAHPVNVGYFWLDERGERIEGEHRELLEHNLEPGASAPLELSVRVPDHSGRLTLCVDLVREGIRWFGLERRFDLTIRNAFRVANYPLSFERCEFPWKSMHIKVDGDVYPCCFLSKPMGNVLQSGVDGVWNGPAYQRLRRSVAMGTYEVCKGAHCKFVTNDPVPAFLAGLQCRKPPRLFLPAETQTFEVEVTNKSRVTWQARGDDVDSVVHLSYHWFQKDGDPRIFDGLRSQLPHDVEPGQTVRVPLTVMAPRRPGRLTLCVDLVMEHVSWFANAGNPPLNLPMIIVERPRTVRARVHHWLQRQGLATVSAPD
jgi:radical SAM protein with 4Fe4S-binding SPASM domain